MAEKELKENKEYTEVEEDGLGLFDGRKDPDVKTVWKMYEQGKDFNTAINLNETVQKNENFYIGKQWEGIKANGLPTPQFNLFKRVVGFIVSTITSDNIKVDAKPFAATANTGELVEPVRIVNEEFEAIMERLNIPTMVREVCRNAAVDGDGCMYTYWDADAETGQKNKGAIQTEVIENDRVFFGNPNDRRVQTQPWIIVSRRMMIRAAKKKAKENGIDTWRDITPDDEDYTVDSAKRTDNKVTELLILWRDDETDTIHAYEVTQHSATKKPWDTGLKLYPIVWFNWDYVRDCYHGQAMITGLIPNQEFINKAWAMSMVSMMKLAFPKVVYNATLIKGYDNRVGAAIPIQGGDINNVVKIIDPPAISPQINQFIQAAQEQTEKLLGATAVAMGDSRPDNTSAIIALQRAASTPTELTKQNLYKCIEDLFRIYLDFMAEYYGKRDVDMETPEQVRQAAQFAGVDVPDEIPMPFDFKMLKDHPMKIKLDIGASSYYSEIASIQTLDNLLQMERIDVLQYLERIPDGYIPARRALINELKNAQQQQMAMQQMQMMPPDMMGGGGQPTDVEGDVALPEAQTEVHGGGGYSALQRKINETGSAAGLV